MTCNIGHDKLPPAGLDLINRLNRAGFEAWFVGGCVRDLLLGISPHDWDICTSARPEQTEQVLREFTIHETGIRHGTVLVMADGEGFEITTFRREGSYSDHRRPDSVRFVRELSEDLARRDFSINAMAYHSRFGLIDLFGGKADLESGQIRAVGLAQERFHEDALRILRALRFAGRFGFSVESATAQAIYACRADLALIAPERIFDELKGILTTDGAPRLMLEYGDIFSQILPEVQGLIGFDQNNPHHDSDAWAHTARTVAAVPAQNVVLRLAALLHDVGKPDCCSLDARNISHFHGHNQRSKELACQALKRLRCDNETRQRVEQLVGLHDRPLPVDLPAARRFLAKTGEQAVEELLMLRRADVLAQSPYQREKKLKQLDDFARLWALAKADAACWRLSDLAIGGKDLLALGIAPGPEVGRLLQLCLDAVIDGRVVNDREALLELCREQSAKK